MTRVNLIHPSELTDQHLVAEYRELRLLTANLKRHHTASSTKRQPIPEKFTLNKGHCSFFRDKGAYIGDRYQRLYEEMLIRGMSPNFPSLDVSWWPAEHFNDWEPTSTDCAIVRERIQLRLKQRPNWYRYKGIICN